MERRPEVKIRQHDGSILDCQLDVNAAPPYRIRLRIPGFELNRSDFIADDLFEAMLMLRRELELKGARLLCAGARPDVYPSPMSRSGSGGVRAYITKLGCQTSHNEMVDIFDYADAESVGTVEQQSLFHKAWMDSLHEGVAEISPLPGEVEEARKFPNGYVYRISGKADPAKGVPPEAVLGAWRVGPTGEIAGSFIANSKYDPIRWPFKD